MLDCTHLNIYIVQIPIMARCVEAFEKAKSTYKVEGVLDNVPELPEPREEDQDSTLIKSLKDFSTQ